MTSMTQVYCRALAGLTHETLQAGFRATETLRAAVPGTAQLGYSASCGVSSWPSVQQLAWTVNGLKA